MVKIMDAQAVAELHNRFARRVSKHVDKAAPDCPPEQKKQLEDYVVDYAAAYRVSKGQLPQPESLVELASGGSDAIKQAKADLGKRFVTKQFQEMAQQPAKDHPHHGTLFEESDRVYIPLEAQPSGQKGLTEEAVTTFLEQGGYTVVDYAKGTATKDGGKNIEKIGRILGRSENSDLLDRFSNDRVRTKKNAESDLMMVVSRSPEDIAACSTARPWTSCMSEQSDYGVNHRLSKDIEAGSVVAYLTSTDDPNINAPLARRLLKPYVNEQGETIMMPDNGYGLVHNGFKKQAYDFCAEHFNKEKVGQFRIKKGLYQDGITGFELSEDGNFKVITRQSGVDDQEVRKLPDNMRHSGAPIEDILGYLGYDYERRQDGTLVVNSVDLGNLGLTRLPDMRHVEVRADFRCDVNQLTSF